MLIGFVLTADGPIHLPRIDIAIYAESVEAATLDASTKSGIMSQSGYFSFNLFDVRDNERHVRVCGFKVETLKPLVNTI